jgi:hypothetical protein
VTDRQVSKINTRISEKRKEGRAISMVTNPTVQLPKIPDKIEIDLTGVKKAVKDSKDVSLGDIAKSAQELAGTSVSTKELRQKVADIKPGKVVSDTVNNILDDTRKFLDSPLSGPRMKVPPLLPFIFPPSYEKPKP